MNFYACRIVYLLNPRPTLKSQVADRHMVAMAQEMSIGEEHPPPANNLSTSWPYVLQLEGGGGATQST